MTGKTVELLDRERTVLVSEEKLQALGKPRPNAVKFFCSIELIRLLADPDWLGNATKTIGQFWKRKNARRNGLTTRERADAVAVVR